jgi:hypothetical protein
MSSKSISKPTPPPELLAAIKQIGIAPAKLQLFATVEQKPVYNLVPNEKEAIKLWDQLRTMVAKTGYWPLIMEPTEGVWLKSDMTVSDQISASWAAGLKKHAGRSFDKKMGVADMILETGLKLDTDDWLKKNRYPDPTGGGDFLTTIAEITGQKIEKSKLKQKPNVTFQSVLKPVIIALWPANEGWQVPALMRYGGWNSCPMAHLQVAMLRRWNLKYGAELVAIANDIVELKVSKPPKTTAAALELAREHYTYCGDIVSQGTGTLERLAERLKDGTVWYFWWD